MPTEQFGQRVFRARMQLAATRGKTVTQGDVAAMVGVATTTVSSWETGGKEPGRAMIQKLAAALSVSAAWLAWGEGEMAAANPPSTVRSAAEVRRENEERAAEMVRLTRQEEGRSARHTPKTPAVRRRRSG